MDKSKPMHFLSLGAGVQSSTLALMFAKGELTPMPDGAIFADTGAEPKYVYDWLDWLETQLPFPVHRVMHKEGLRKNIIENLNAGKFASVPFFAEGKGMLRRQCTREFKLLPLTKKIRQLVGLKYRQRAPKTILAVSYIGISLDESIRMKPSREHWIKHKWPLIDKGMRRWDCLEWMQKNGYPQPERSSCTFCPYHPDTDWKDLKNNHPKDFEDAIKIDKMIRKGVRGAKRKLYLHRSLVPLDEADFATAEDHGQLNMFNNECEGMCGV